MSQADELFVKQEDDIKRIIYLIKELIKSKKELKVVSSYVGAMVASKATNALVDMGYINITGINTVTEVKSSKRRISLFISIEKAENFDKLYEENIEKRRKYNEEKEKNEK